MVANLVVAGFSPRSQGEQMRLNARNAHLIIFLVVILSSKVLGQSTFGSIVGTVKDSSGSVVPMANVKFVNEGTAVERTV